MNRRKHKKRIKKALIRSMRYLEDKRNKRCITKEDIQYFNKHINYYRNKIKKFKICRLEHFNRTQLYLPPLYIST